MQPIVQKYSHCGPSVEFIYRGGMWIHEGEFAIDLAVGSKILHRSQNSALYSVVQGRDAFLDDGLFLHFLVLGFFQFQDLTFCSNFSCF